MLLMRGNSGLWSFLSSGSWSSRSCATARDTSAILARTVLRSRLQGRLRFTSISGCRELSRSCLATFSAPFSTSSTCVGHSGTDSG